MDAAAFRDLLSPAGQQALQAAEGLQPVETDFLRHFSHLARRFPPDLARAALETAILRREAGDKFPQAERMYFTRPALEQASSQALSTYRVQRFAPFDRLADLGCSIGGDTLSLAAQAPTLAIDLDALRLALAQANLQALGLAQRARLVRADLADLLPLHLNASLALFFDPARRSGERRIFSVEDYQPPLSILERWLPFCPALGVKISPGVDLDELRPYDAEVEFISLKGELKEAVLWFGPLKTAHRRATLLPGPHTLASSSEPSQSVPENGSPARLILLSQPGAYLYEPDPAILRAGLVQHLGLELGASQLDPDIAYLTSDRRVETPFARCWAVDAWFPFSLKRLRLALRERRVGQVVVKKRGSPLQPQELIHALRLNQGPELRPAERLVFLTHLQGQPIAILCLPGPSG
jgi:hypothetical protein